MIVYELEYKDGNYMISENCEDWYTQRDRLKDLLDNGFEVICRTIVYGDNKK